MFSPDSINDLQTRLRAEQYIADRGLATSVFLALKLQRPLLLEGEAGVGKTEVAKVLASALDTPLIRLQCYEGLDIAHAVYEWNYARQLLEIRLMEASGAVSQNRDTAAKELFDDKFLIKRPLLQAISASQPPVLLIDELDRADDEFEGFLLELLSDYQITIPELGTIRAAQPPVVVLTSNRTRELHDALKRRCLYYWIDYPDFAKELSIIHDQGAGGAVQTGRTGHGVRAGAQGGRALQAAWRVRNPRLDHRPRRARQGGARRRHHRPDTRHRAEEPGGHPGYSRRTGAGDAESGETPGTMSALLSNLLHFSRLLGDLGLDVQAVRTLDIVRALDQVEIGRRSDFYHTLRCLLVRRPQDIPLFDEAFRVFWRPPPGNWTTDDLRAMGEHRRTGAPKIEAPARPSGGEPTLARPLPLEYAQVAARS